MRRLVLLAAAIVLLLGAGATAWAQVDPSPSTTITTEPVTTIPGTTIPGTTIPGTTIPETTIPGSSTSSTMCAIGTTTTFCFPVSTPPPTTEPPCECDGRQVITRNPAKYAERAQEDRAQGLTCFNIRLVSGTFVVSASGDAQLLDWLFQ